MEFVPNAHHTFTSIQLVIHACNAPKVWLVWPAILLLLPIVQLVPVAFTKMQIITVNPAKVSALPALTPRFAQLSKANF